ncbi:ribosomal protein S18-alanine N-acetyltransferase [Alteromonas facilis]|uniref:ribosomal protein S18-alanine N-acetyltransferase n=1 Tax=Alteromonas facilis TaxID=2048004 RepID=UPI000C2894B8|nr:ribosomal protein S18-alanine N-acetyltransferase [Alteromonas facilis]
MDKSFSPLIADTPESDSAYSICRLSHPAPWSRKVFMDCMTSPYFAYVMIQEGKVLGYYIGLLVAEEATLMDVAVAESSRNQGLGRLLVEHFIRMAESKSASESWLEVRASNTHAIRLYECMGFETITVRKDYYSGATPESAKEDAIIMRRIS